MSKDNLWDLIVIGGGPAGLTAAIYARRYGLSTLVLADSFGGLAAKAHKICNYPSEKEITGFELAEKIRSHAQAVGATLKMATVAKAVKEEKVFTIFLQTGGEFLAKTVILALGAKNRRLNLPSEEKYLGKGVSYCFTCDGMFFKSKRVGVVGGSDAAVTAALYFADICPEVFLIYRRNQLRAERAWLERLKEKGNVVVIYNTNIVDLSGEDKLAGVVLDKAYQGTDLLPLDGLFIEIGNIPNQIIIKPLDVETDENDFIKIDPAGRTSVDGIWAAGDVTTGSNGLRQIITACAEGAIAAKSVFDYLSVDKE